LRQFLEVDDTLPATQRSYTLYHRSFADFLLDEDRAEEYWCEGAAQHRRIATFYLTQWGGLEQGLPRLAQVTRLSREDAYPFQHLSTHLRLAGAYDDLFALVDNRTWYVAQEQADASAAQYLNDVAHAWGAAEAVDTNAITSGRNAPLLGREVKCALVTASLHSRSGNIPSALLIALVKKGVWDLPHTLRVVRQNPDPESKIREIATLAPHLPEQERPAVLHEALNLTSTT
jgi:hypothetical protein